MTLQAERLYAASCAGMFVFGMILGLPGTVLGQLETVERFGLTLADRGLLVSTLFGGLLVGSLISGPLVDALGQRRALVLSLSLVALCLPLFAIASSGVFAASALFALGVTSASINTASNALSSELFPHERGRRMNGIAVMVGLGGLSMPTTTVLAANLVSWRAVIGAGAVLAAAIALFIGVRSLYPSSPTLSDQTGTIAALRRHSRQPGFVWCLLLILLGGGNEASMAGWTSTFVIASGFGSATATGVLASHWLGVIVSRALFANRVDREKEVAVERSAVLSTLALVVLVVSASPAMVMLGPFAVGLCIALVMPTSLAIAGERLPGNPGALFGAMLTVAQVGGILLPSLIGLVAEYTSVRTGLAILIGSYGAIALTVRHLSSDLFQQSVKAG